ncbi:MAG: cytochrome c [candidate division NC10 bacterium]|nr:cytochrome c [candidate division NC10 bacterium]
MQRQQRWIVGTILVGLTMLFTLVPLSGDDPAIIGWPTLAEAQQAGGNTPQVDLKDPAVIQEGAAIYNRNCTFYCHGQEGRPKLGPKLRGRQLDKDFLFKVMADGQSKMPGFKGRLTDEQIWKLVAYILSLSDAKD